MNSVKQGNINYDKKFDGCCRSNSWLRYILMPIILSCASLLFSCGSSDGDKKGANTKSAEQTDENSRKIKKKKKVSNSEQSGQDDAESKVKNKSELPQMANIGGFMGLDPEIVQMFMSGKFDLTKLNPKQLAQVQAFIDRSGGLTAMMQGMSGPGMPGFPQGGWPTQPPATSSSPSTSTTTSATTSTTTQTATSTQTSTSTVSAVSLTCTMSCPARCSDGSVRECPVTFSN